MTTAILSPAVVTTIVVAQTTADDAQTTADDAQTTADGKNKVYRQTSAPGGSSHAVGDLWFDTDDGNKFYRWTGAAWDGFELGDSAIASISANKITAGTIDASVITVSNLDAGNITTGSLDASVITVSNLNASNITTGTLSADNISGGTITGVTIDAQVGNIGGFTLSGGTLLGSAAGTLINPNGQIDIAGALNASGEVNSGSDMNASGNIEANGHLSAGSVVYAGYLIGSGTVADSGVDVVRRSDGYYLKKTSIRSVKENIESFTNALDIVNALTPRTFNWKQNTGPLPDPDNIHTQQIKYAHKSHGFIVDEVQNVSEELVHWEIKADGVSLEPVMWKTDDLIAVSVQAIKDLVAQIGTLEARIAALESK